MTSVTNWKVTKSSCQSSISRGYGFRGYAKSPEGNRAVILDICDLWLEVGVKAYSASSGYMVP